MVKKIVKKYIKNQTVEVVLQKFEKYLKIIIQVAEKRAVANRRKKSLFGNKRVL